MTRFHWIGVCLLGGLLLTGASTRAGADAWNQRTYVTISQPIEVPGAVLPAGKYLFKLQDSASNRHIVQIMDAAENHLYATTMAIPLQQMSSSDKTILTFYEMPGGGPEPIRAWFYPGETTGQQFLYSRQRAAEIAQAINQTVPVLSERAALTVPPAAPSPVVAAPPAQFTPAADDADTAPASKEAAVPALATAPAEIAQAQPPQDQPRPEGAAPQAASPTDATPSSGPAQLPKTAGESTLFGLLGIGCLGVAVSLRMALRRAAGSK